tara:strand:- start:182 stop:343 length:162 start_codon:yes stop_codon:yes gene_type:complete
MKLKRRNFDPLLRRAEGKTTPHRDWDDPRYLIIEQKKLGLKPKLQRSRVIVSG